MPERKYKLNTVRIKCGDCGTFMVRAKDPLMPQEPDHIISKCPKCHVEIGHFKGTSIVITDKRPFLQVDWNLSMEEKKKILESMKKKKEWREQMKRDEAEFNRQLEEEYKKEQESNKKNVEK